MRAVSWERAMAKVMTRPPVIEVTYMINPIMTSRGKLLSAPIARAGFYSLEEALDEFKHLCSINPDMRYRLIELIVEIRFWNVGSERHIVKHRVLRFRPGRNKKLPYKDK